MQKTFRFRIYPTRKQRAALSVTLEECRWVYNQTIAHRRDAWQERGERVTWYDCYRLLPSWREKRPSLGKVNAQVLQDVQRRVDLAFKGFFRRVKAGEKPGYPRFKGRGRYDSLTYRQSGFGLKDGLLRLSKVGCVKVKMHRPLGGTPKQVTVRRTATGKWYACFVCEVKPQPLPKSEKAVGVDVGLAHFATLSTGEKTPNPRFFRTDEKALADAQRKLSKAEKGSPERAKRRKVVARIHERISNRRGDFAHQLSRKLVNAFGIIALEDLNCKQMVQDRRLAKSISDAAWSQFAQYTTYKAEEAGRQCVRVDPRNTSKVCSQCGALVAKSLSQRVHSCPHCGLRVDRDLNAARNILRLGLQSLASA